MTADKIKFNYVWQPLGAVIFVSIVLAIFSQIAQSDILWAVGSGALASTSYIVFGKPHGNTAKPQNIIGGYLVGIIAGEIMRFVIMAFHIPPNEFIGSSHYVIVSILTAFSVGLSLFMMSLLKLEHPPAAGMALVLVIDMRHYYELAIIFAAALCIATIRWLAGKWLKDLF